MKYVSTRGGMPPMRFTDVLLGGLAPDGGLVVPEHIPVLTEGEMAEWHGLSYAAIAFEVMRRFMDDIPPADLERLIAAAYGTGAFAHPDVVSLREVEPDLYLAGLSHGPTLAFKDIALQMVGQLFEYELERRGEHLTVLGATSGDTGSSAEYAMVGKHNVDVFMLTPLGKTSPFQAAQMYTLDEPNIFNLAVRGVFDDCQDLVKAVNGDAAFKARYRIGAVNSINWARIAAQVVYYVYAATRVGAPGRRVSFGVPTGNFGNVYAGFVARRMGVPIQSLVVATNENDVLDEFFSSGRYHVRTTVEVASTSSPSMDISKASNFERYVYALLGDDPVRTRALFSDLGSTGGFDLAGTAAFDGIAATGFVSGSSTHGDRIATIRRFANEFDIVIDPHTADGLKVGLGHFEPGVPLICLETAQPVKFAATIEEALGESPEMPPRLRALGELPQHYETVDADIEAVKAYIAANATTTPRP